MVKYDHHNGCGILLAYIKVIDHDACVSAVSINQAKFHCKSQCALAANGCFEKSFHLRVKPDVPASEPARDLI